MIIDGQSYPDCDFCGEHKEAKFGYVARGATGRHCVVMSACGDCIGDAEVTPIQQARDEVNAKPGDQADF